MTHVAMSTNQQMTMDDVIANGLDDYEGVDIAVSFLLAVCHGMAKRTGWWTDPHTGQPLLEPLAVTKDTNKQKAFAAQYKQYVLGTKLALIHSEISEALEGARKNLPDDKLPQYPMVVVELADAIIRILDTAGAFGYNNIGEVLLAKLRYNDSRADHKLDARSKDGGKAF